MKLLLSLSLAASLGCHYYVWRSVPVKLTKTEHYTTVGLDAEGQEFEVDVSPQKEDGTFDVTVRQWGGYVNVECPRLTITSVPPASLVRLHSQLSAALCNSLAAKKVAGEKLP